MSLVLYRKYRPQTFQEFIGQNHIKVTLQNEIETGKVAHAYIFSGPRGVGKTTAARLLAKAINCERRKEGESEPCNYCESCEEIREGRSLDVIEIDAASHTGVDNVRENIINNARFTPSKRKYKVFIIDEVHMLSISAFNALLKTIEQPPPYVVFILATTEIYKVPATIISRCQRFDFKKVNLNDIVERLKLIVDKEGIKIDLKILENIARHADGSIRDAESLLGQVLALATSKTVTQSQAELIIPKSDFNLVADFAESLILHNAEAGLRLINNLVEEGRDLGQFSQDLIEFLRKVLIAQVSNTLLSQTAEFSEELEKKIFDLSKKIETKDLVSMIELLMEKKKEIKFSDIHQLPLELAVVEICGKNHSRISENFKYVSGNNDFSDKVMLSGQNNEILKQIQEKWPEILGKVKDCNHSLLLSLQLGYPVAFENDILQIGFKYRFHKEKINEKRNRETLERVIKEMLKVQLRVNGVIADVPEFSYAKDDGMDVEEILKEFGGSLVE